MSGHKIIEGIKQAIAGDLTRVIVEGQTWERTAVAGFLPVVSLGTDKNGEIDFRINMSIAEYDRARMDALCRMMPWAIKEALTLWLDHGPPSKEHVAKSGAHFGR